MEDFLFCFGLSKEKKKIYNINFINVLALNIKVFLLFTKVEQSDIRVDVYFFLIKDPLFKEKSQITFQNR